MFLFKYERFIHAFLMFWWLFVRSINQAKNGGQKGHFCIISEYHSPRLATNSPGRVSTFSIKQPTRLGECLSLGWVSLTPLVSFSINRHANQRKESSEEPGGRSMQLGDGKEKGSGVELPICGRGSLSSSFLLLMLCSTQWSTSFSKGLDVIFIPLCISFDIIHTHTHTHTHTWISSTHYWWFHYVRNAWFYLITSFMKLDLSLIGKYS